MCLVYPVTIIYCDIDKAVTKLQLTVTVTIQTVGCQCSKPTPIYYTAVYHCTGRLSILAVFCCLVKAPDVIDCAG